MKTSIRANSRNSRLSRVIRADAGGARRLTSWLSIRNEEDDSKPVELLIYDQIGKDWWDNSGVDARTFAETLAGIDADREIVVAINSPGGNVWDGLAIYNRLQTRKKYVTTRIDGIAASIASIIALAGKETQIPRNALLMIHDPSGLVVGTADDMRQLADELDKHADVLADIYATKAGGSARDWRKKMQAETWFNGTEAEEAGLADTVLGEITVKAHFDLSRCRNVPASLQQQNQNQPSRRAANPPPDPMKRKELLALFASLSVTMAADAADAVLLAELQKLFAAGKVTAEKFEELTGKKPEAAAAATAAANQPAGVQANAAGGPTATVTTVSREEFQAIHASLRRERDRRLTGEFNAVAAENPVIGQRREYWLPQLLASADDTAADGLLAELRRLPAPFAGVDPIRPTIAVLGHPLMDRYTALAPGAERRQFRRENLQAIQRARREFRGPQNVNTFDVALVPDHLADGLIIVAHNKLAALRALSRDFSLDPLAPGKVVQVKKATATSAAQTNPANFETGDSSLDNVAVTVNQISKSFHITQAQANQGFRLDNIAEINSDTFANAISDVWTALLLTASGPADEVIGAAAAFDKGQIAAIRALAKNFRMKNLVLDGDYTARIYSEINPSTFKMAPQGDSGAYGFDNLAEQNRWTGADPNTVGITNGPDAIAVASGLPVETAVAGEFQEMRTITLPGIELTVVIHVWFSRGTRTVWASYDVMFGATLGDTTQIVILKSA